MKKILTCIFFTTLLITYAFAGGGRDNVDYSNPVSVQDKILELAEKNYKANSDEISVLASHLTINEREIVYSLLEIDPSGCGSRNFFLGWGEGSYSIGDNTAGSLLWLADTLSLAAILTPAVPLAMDSFKAKQLNVTEEWMNKWMYPFGIAGLSAGLLSRLISIPLPSVFAKKRNADYRETLGLSQHVSVFVIPQFDPVNQNAGVTVCLSF